MCAELSRAIERYKRIGAKLVVLFGSRARGDHTEDSDYDVLVVGDNIPKDPREAYTMLVDLEYPKMHPIGLDTESFLKRLREGSPFILEVLEDGKVLYADNEFLNNTMEEFRRIRARFLRVNKTWLKLQ